MTGQQSSYRQIMKATTIFGGVQVFNILISIIRSKFVAVLLGPAGMGIMGLLTSTTGFIASLTNFGLSTSAVKDIAAANSSEDQNRISTVVTIFRRLVWITGLLGTLITLFFSSWLSLLTFGNTDYTYAFVCLSITLLLSQLNSGQMVLLQGMRQLKLLAKADLAGSALGLFITLPLYYYYGKGGIVPGIVASALLLLLLSLFYSRKIDIKPISVSSALTISEGKGMLRMGFLISMSGLLSVGASYIVRVFIGRTGGVEQVGLYNAGFSIINTYVGLVFNAMATDYYPRLSAVAHDNSSCRQIVNQQAEIALLILAPILVVFLVFINWVVVLLYSHKFVDVNVMIYWAALGMFFKAASWSVAFVFIAKGASKLFFWSELAANIYVLVFNLIGYYYWGLAGLGLSFVAAYLLYLIQVFFISKKMFDFSFDNSFRSIFTIQFSFAVAGFLAVSFFTPIYAYGVGIILISLSVWFSFRELEKRIGLIAGIKSFLHETRNNLDSFN